MKSLQKLSVKIDRINSRGMGKVFDKNNLSLQIPFSLPGEIIDFTYDDELNPHSINIKTSSPDRIKPACPHFQKCGGCSLQHASDSFVVNWKESIVTRELAKKELFPQFRSTYVTPERSRRRAIFSARRTKKGTIVGFKSLRSNLIVPVLGCVIIDRRVLSFFPGMELITMLACSRSSTIKIYVSLSENGLDVLITGGKFLDKELRSKLIEIAVEYDLARLSWNDELVVLIKPPIQQLGNITVVPPENFFMQATKEAETLMVDDVCQALENNKNVVDLFSGLGTFSLPLSRTSTIVAFEQSFEMLKSLDRASRQTPKLKKIKIRRRNLHKNPVSAEELSDVDGAVVNPPRAGALAQCKELARSNIEIIVLVSCNPRTFARDSEILTKGFYNLDWVRVIDQFRWSHHIEVVGKFSRTY